MRRASAVPGSTKYGCSSAGRLSKGAVSLPSDKMAQLALLTSLGLTRKTWANYKTAEVMLAKCCKQNNIKKELPITEATTISFILWLANERKAKAATINSYLAGVRQLHIMKGLEPPTIRTGLVKLALKGKAHMDAAANRTNGHEERQPITPDILLLLKARLKSSSLAAVDKRLVWTVCTIAFFGAFRGVELLCRSESSFDPAYTLLAEDVVLVQGQQSDEDSLQLKIKAPKEDKLGRSVVVDVFRSREDICPVTAYQKWKALRPPGEAGQPAFRWADGTPLTSRKLNTIMRERLTGYLEGADRLYTSHSFRTGAASMMGSLGYSDDDIKAIGKWTSNAFECYTKLPRTKRRAVAKDFGSRLR